TFPGGQGCDSTAILQLKIIRTDTTIVQHESMLSAPAADASYQWLDCSRGHTAIPGATGRAFTAEQRGYYALAVMQDGCADTSACRYVWFPGNFLPDAFTPNGDGRNDIFRIGGITYERVLEFRVYNRWGETVYASPDAAGGWDGT